jgi:hypothetical protein
LQNKENDHNKKQREMDFIKAVNIIGKDLDEARALLDQLSTVPGTHVAETELAKARIRTATELLRLLPGLTGAPAPETETEMKVRDIKKEIEEIIVTTQRAEIKTEPEPAPAHEPAPTPDHVSAPASSPESAHEPSPAQSQARQKEAVKAILADRFGATGTIGEKISSPIKDDAITTAMHNRPVADIGAAIGINDKFYYIRELFSGDATAYSDTVSRLNSAGSLGEAMRILDESTVMGSDPAAQSSFVDVVRRKFSLNV